MLPLCKILRRSREVLQRGSTILAAGCDCVCCCLDRFIVGLIFSIIVVFGWLIFGTIFCVCKKYLVGEHFEDFSIWVWILCPLTGGVWLIWEKLIREKLKNCCKNCCNSEPAPSLGGGRSEPGRGIGQSQGGDSSETMNVPSSKVGRNIDDNGCQAGCNVGFCLMVASFCLMFASQIGSIVYVFLRDISVSGNSSCCEGEDEDTCCEDKDLCGDGGIWFWIVCPFIIGLVIMSGGLIWKCCKDNAGNGDAPPRDENPHPETQSGNQHGGQQMSKKEKKKAKEAEANIKNEQHDQGKKRREQPPIPDGATGTTLSGREDSDSAVSRQQVELEETGHSLERRPMPAIPPAQGSQGKNNKIQDSKGRGLSANSDDDHLLVGIDTPSQRKGALKKINEDNL